MRRIKVQESNEHSRFHYQPTYTRRKLELHCHSTEQKDYCFYWCIYL
jgi:hypothetical protein